MEIAVLGNEHFVAGFQLAGIRKTYISGQNVQDTFRKAVGDQDIGILIMDNEDFEKLDEKHQEQAMTQIQPTVVLLSHDVSTEDSLRLMIIRALGIDLWKKEDV